MNMLLPSSRLKTEVGRSYETSVKYNRNISTSTANGNKGSDISPFVIILSTFFRTLSTFLLSAEFSQNIVLLFSVSPGVLSQT
jgi:hypothetical protein